MSDQRISVLGHRGVRGSGPWCVHMLCCGREDGVEAFETYEEADAFREQYALSGHRAGYSALSHEPGHRRAGVITDTRLAPKQPRRKECADG